MQTAEIVKKVAISPTDFAGISLQDFGFFKVHVSNIGVVSKSIPSIKDAIAEAKRWCAAISASPYTIASFPVTIIDESSGCVVWQKNQTIH